MLNLKNIFNKLSDPFKTLTEEEKNSLKEVELSVKRDIREFSRNAKELFDDQRYKKLKEEFKRVYEQNLRLIVYFDCEDPHKYIMKMREYQIQLRVMKNIFDTPEGFIKSEEAVDKNVNKNKQP